MNQFTESHLKTWKEDYLKLINRPRYYLVEENIWMLGDKHGILCVFDDEEIVYISYCKSIYKTLKEIINVNKNNELINLILMYEIGISEKKAKTTALSNINIKKIKKIVSKFTYSLITIDLNHIQKVAQAFKVVSDPIYNGHTSNLNKVLDDLPTKK
ncbi:MAG: hypothetical protein P8K05_04735 [Dehalococcoidia bacterium]|jgi:hypothetical protein|nr:hypothetical protein [Dehalococcoidia bacterium]